ncbi:hypothetical protein IP65_17925 [Novosphingobium sp. AAP1]|uniref:hypothetical protein n=1 Tax=Novosphingobium sp. AAP1 TaxID=1523413 RepID=UPI0006B9CB33|nr:hypothetical protein [Novosphingobium sp. AAP1]KPF52070.1 hypothetical protein IP65_17925 [Novosphingobium sp. AAP1]
MSVTRRIGGGLVLLWPGLAQAQQLGGGGSPNISLLRVLISLLVALACAFGLALFLRARMGQHPAPASLGQWLSRMGTSRRIEVVEARRVSAYADLCLVRNEGEEWLLACGPAGITVLRHGLAPVREDTAVAGGKDAG